MVIDTSCGQVRQIGHQIDGAGEVQAAVEDNDLRTQEMELLILFRPGHHFALIKSLLKDLDQFLAQGLLIDKIGGQHHTQPFGQGLIVQTVIGPRSEIVVIFRFIEAGLQQTPP